MGPTRRAAPAGTRSSEPRSPGVSGDAADGAPMDQMTAVTAEPAAVPESENRFQEEITGYVRSPSDVLRTVVFSLATLLLVVLAKWSRDAVLPLENDLIQRLSFFTPAVERILAGALTLVVLVSVTAAWAVPLVTRRYRLFGYLLVGDVLVSLLLRGVEWFLDRGDPDFLMREVAQRAGVDSPLTVYGIAQTATSFVVLGPFVSRRWRRAGAVLLTLITLLRLLVPVTLPATVAVALGLGAAVGSGTLLMFGRPSGRPTRTAIAAALTSSGLPVAELEPAAVDARG
jgi:hypothetical protein